MTDREKLKAAIDTIAGRIARNAIFDAIEQSRITREDFEEEITEADFDAVSYRARQIADSLDHSNEAYYAACEVLETRAKGGHA
ncbi:hypothetical protein [Amycolatopsis pigmentata]|uniref:Uncharacterized protein n=1 Tax=Amycolatopsis pigmentata TaxID=450801 RepID=A0ABW5G3U7_9PSEU